MSLFLFLFTRLFLCTHTYQARTHARALSLVLSAFLPACPLALTGARILVFHPPSSSLSSLPCRPSPSYHVGEATNSATLQLPRGREFCPAVFRFKCPCPNFFHGATNHRSRRRRHHRHRRRETPPPGKSMVPSPYVELVRANSLR